MGKAIDAAHPDSLADVDLVARAIAGSEDGFEALVRRYQRPIAAYIYRIVNDYDAALDLTQEVFIKIYGSLTRYRAEYKFSTWIYRIAHNVAIDHLRRAAARDEMALKPRDERRERLVISMAPSPEQEQERDERRTQIEAIVDRLPTAYRELIVLRHGHDLSYEEIVEVTGLPLGTVKNRIFRAREMMRRMLIEQGITGF
jgi:RNA polymerase sigma-70 factor (ECF subfamily)